jgi:hypothetical protein
MGRSAARATGSLRPVSNTGAKPVLSNRFDLEHRAQHRYARLHQRELKQTFGHPSVTFSSWWGPCAGHAVKSKLIDQIRLNFWPGLIVRPVLGPSPTFFFFIYELYDLHGRWMKFKLYLPRFRCISRTCSGGRRPM